MYRIIQKRKILISISATLVGLSIIAFIIWGLNPGIDFTGGSLLEVRYNATRPEINTLLEQLKPLQLKSLSIQPNENNGLVFRYQETEETVHQNIIKKLNEKNSVEELRFESVGPTVGKELRRNAIYSIIIVLICIIAYIAWAFRKVTRPVESWKYGLAGVLALLHDVIIVVGVYAVLGRFFGIEINTSFIAALLTILGYSINDTIVVFDRIRENLPKSDKDFEGTVNDSLNQTLVRSINTSMTVMLVLLAIVLFGGESIKYFALALLIGVFFGTYSSIFLASPLLVVWEKMKKQ